MPLSLGLGLGLTRGGGVAAPYYQLGFDGQSFAHLAGPMDADPTLAMHATTGTVTRSWRAAATLRLASGTILDFFVQQRDGSAASDSRIAGIYVRSSDDECETWSAMRCIYLRETSGTADYASGSKWINGPLGVVQHTSGRIHLIFCKSDGADPTTVMTAWHMSSADDGATWNGAALCTAPTNISAAVVKANNATPASQPACYGEADAAWVWYMITSGLCVENGANAGRIYMFGDHRYTLGGTSWTHCFYTDNGDSATPTWVLGGGYDETVAGNDNSNEVACVEIGASGHILIQNRIQTGASVYFRGQATLTNPTTTWPAMDLATNGVADLEANNVHGTLWKNADGSKVFAAFATDESVRANLRVYESTDDGATWTVGRTIHYGHCGYCYGLALAGGKHRVLFEKTHNYGQEAFGAQYQTQARFNELWLENEADYPAVLEWGFSESQTGIALATVGSQLLSSGTRGVRIFDQRGLGGANASFYSSGGQYGITFAGSGSGVVLQEAQADGIGGACQSGFDSITYEATVTLAAGATTRVLADDCNNTGAGTTLYFTSGGLAKLRIGDGTASATTASGTTDLYDGQPHTLAFVIDRVGGTARIYETTTGTAVPLCDSLDISAVTGKVVGAYAFTLGRTANSDTSKMAAGDYLRRMRVTHSALSGGWMSHAGTVTTHDDLLPPPTVPTIADFPNDSPTLWLGSTYDGGYYGRADKYGAFDPLHKGTVLGRGMASARNAAGGQFFNFGTSISRGAYWDSDADVGPHWRYMYLSTTTNGNYNSCTAAGATGPFAPADVIQETGNFALFMCFKLLTDSSVQLWDNCNNSASEFGSCLSRSSSSGALTWRVANDSGSTYFNEAVPTLTVGINTWTCLMVTAAGGGKYIWYKATIAGGEVTIVNSAVNSTSNVPTPLGSGLGAAINPLCVFSRSGSSAGAANIRAKNVMLFPAAVSTAGFAALCQLCADY